MSFQAPGKFAHSQSRQAREITQHSPYRTYCCSARHALPCGASKFHVSVTQTTPVHHGTLEALSSFNDCLHTRRSLQLNLRSPSAMHGMMGGGTTLCTTELDSRQPKLKTRAPAPPGSPTVHVRIHTHKPEGTDVNTCCASSCAPCISPIHLAQRFLSEARELLKRQKAHAGSARLQPCPWPMGGHFS